MGRDGKGNERRAHSVQEVCSLWTMFQPRHRVSLSLQLRVESVLLSDYNQWDIKQFYHTLLHYRMKKQESKEAEWTCFHRKHPHPSPCGIFLLKALLLSPQALKQGRISTCSQRPPSGTVCLQFPVHAVLPGGRWRSHKVVWDSLIDTGQAA